MCKKKRTGYVHSLERKTMVRTEMIKVTKWLRSIKENYNLTVLSNYQNAGTRTKHESMVILHTSKRILLCTVMKK